MTLMERKPMATGHGDCDEIYLSSRQSDHARRESPSSVAHFPSYSYSCSYS